jgi:uncharacterized membrane protein
VLGSWLGLCQTAHGACLADKPIRTANSDANPLVGVGAAVVSFAVNPANNWVCIAKGAKYMVSSSEVAASPEPAYSQTTTRNVSLSRAGRLLFLGLMFFNTGVLAIACAAVGAWPVLPFAGIELSLLAYAFYYIGKFDGDYERLTIDDAALILEVCERGLITRREFNRPWVKLILVEQSSRCRLGLQYHGHEYRLGKLMNDEQRSAWGRELRKQIRIVSA